MKQVETEYLITFAKTHSMMKGELLLNEVEMSARTMPLPTSLGDSCGFCIRVWEQELEKAIRVLEEADIAVAGVYRIDKKGDRRDYTSVVIEREE
jgi:hypothetical protein